MKDLTPEEALKRLPQIENELAMVRRVLEAKKSPELSADELIKRVVSYETACEIKDITPRTLEQYKQAFPETSESDLDAEFALHQLMVVHDALNGETPLDYSDTDINKWGAWLQWQESNDPNVPSGFGFSASYYGRSSTSTDVGSRLSSNDEKRAIHFNSHPELLKIWNRFLVKK